VPTLDYALLCDYVRAERGIAHAIAAGIDTVYAQEVPTGRNVGLLARVTFTQVECGRPHRIEIIFQNIDGERLVQVQSVVEPERDPNLPVGSPVGAMIGLNIGLPLPSFGLYAFELLINDNHVKTINLRVEQSPVDQMQA
jgi:hypothetical protein